MHVESVIDSGAERRYVYSTEEIWISRSLSISVADVTVTSSSILVRF